MWLSLRWDLQQEVIFLQDVTIHIEVKFPNFKTNKQEQQNKGGGNELFILQKKKIVHN